jgi:methyl-accepting chemotaxis protein
MRTRLTLKQKFDFSFVVLVLLALTVFGAVRYLGKNAQFFHLERNHRLLMSEIRADIAAVRFRSPVARIVSTETLIKKIDRSLIVLRTGQNELTAAEKALFKLGGFGQLFDTMDNSIVQTQDIHALLTKNLGREIDDNMIEEIEIFLDIQYAQSDQFVPLMLKAVTTTKLAVTALSMLSIALVAWAGWVSRRSVLLPLQSAIHAANQITAGDLRVSLATDQQDEMGDLMRALQKMTASITGIVQEVRAGSVAIAGAAEQIAVGHNNLSGRTEHQASTLEQTAASSEELSATVSRNAQLAQEASSLAQDASRAHVRGYFL